MDTLKDSSLMSWIVMLLGIGIMCLTVFITPPKLFTGEIKWS